MNELRQSLRERFDSKWIPVGECMIWIATSNKSYGYIWDGRTQRGAHRVSWELSRGEIPPGLMVLHKCNNKLCVNPGHLYVGDQSRNMRDALRDGLIKRPRWIRCPRGHEYEPDNFKLVERARGNYKVCLTCRRARDRERWHRRRARKMLGAK